MNISALYRYVSKEELEDIKRTGLIVLGRSGVIYLSPECYDDPSEAADKLALPPQIGIPDYRIGPIPPDILSISEVGPMGRVPSSYGRPGGGLGLIVSSPIEVHQVYNFSSRAYESLRLTAAVQVPGGDVANVKGLWTEWSRFLERAIELSEKCRDEDERPRPKVGAVIIKNSRKIAEAFRNEDGEGGHAEQIAMGKCEKRHLNGATLVTTLEPCTTDRRPSQAPCANLILQNGIKTVLIGLLDPNPRIRGNGDLLLRINGKLVGGFPPELSQRIWNLNEKFIRKHTEDAFRAVYLYPLEEELST